MNDEENLILEELKLIREELVWIREGLCEPRETDMDIIAERIAEILKEGIRTEKEE